MPIDPTFQQLLDMSLPSMAKNADAPMLTLADTHAFLRCYIGDRTDRPATLAPGLVEDLSGLPPAYIATAAYDPIRDGGAHYAERLRAARVPVEHHNAETKPHGYISFAHRGAGGRLDHHASILVD